MNKNIYSKNNHCKCGKLISNNAKQCGSCECKGRIGKNASRFVNGKTLKKYYCKICKKEISVTAGVYGTHKCETCCRINNPGYFKHGKTMIRHYCECGTEINYRSEKCNSCENKRKHKLGIINTKGDNNGRWNGGSSFEPYTLEWTKELKEFIRNRDNYKCQKCGIKEKNHYRKLDVHHIDYNKQNCKESNLISLCGKCNAGVNSNRDYWYVYFKYIVEQL